ncbi:MAG: CHASE3 domain-containing protein [Actinocatenispora sp.]
MAITSALLATVIVGVFGFLIYAVTAQRDSAQLSQDTQAGLASANKLERLVIDLQTGERGYVLTRQARFLEPWEMGRQQIPSTERQWTQVVHTPSQLHRAHRLVRGINSYINDYSIPVVDEARRGDPAARSVSTALEGKHRLDALRRGFDAFSAKGQQLAGPLDASARHAGDEAVLGGVFGAAASAVLIVAFVFYVSRAVVRPIRGGAVMAGRFAEGDLSIQMPETDIGEIGVLERSFNTMGAALQRSRAEQTRIADEQAALRRVATLVAHGVPAPEVFAAVAEEIGVLLHTDGTRIFRYESERSATVVAGWSAPEIDVPFGMTIPLEGYNIPVEVLRTGNAARIDDLAQASGPLADRLRHAGVRSVVGAPIIVESRIWGVMAALSQREELLPPDTAARFAEFTALVSTTIANTEARNDLINSRARVVAATDQSRRRIERNLHDGVQQRLVSATLDLRSLHADLPPHMADLRTELAGIADDLTETLDELREVARGIHPAILTEAGLLPALRALARRSPLPVDLDLHADQQLPSSLQAAAYYLIAEALTNATKYSQAPQVRISTAIHDHNLRVSIVDHGIGGADPTHGSGLTGLRDRIESLGGTLTITSHPGDGTTLEANLPISTTV